MRYKQTKLVFDKYNIKIGTVSIDSVLNDINAAYNNFDTREILSMIVFLSKEVFTTKYIMSKTGYSRQTISEIHNMKYTIHGARDYIYYMSRELKALGYDVQLFSYHDLLIKICGN